MILTEKEEVTIEIIIDHIRATIQIEDLITVTTIEITIIQEDQTTPLTVHTIGETVRTTTVDLMIHQEDLILQEEEVAATIQTTTEVQITVDLHQVAVTTTEALALQVGATAQDVATVEDQEVLVDAVDNT